MGDDLRALLKNIYTGIDQFSFLAANVDDDQLRRNFNNTENMFVRELQRSEIFLKQNGLRPLYSSGVRGRLGETAFQIKNSFNSNDKRLLKLAKKRLDFFVELGKNFLDVNRDDTESATIDFIETLVSEWRAESLKY